MTFTVTYKNTGQPAPLVNYNLKTSNNGQITIQISEPKGSYILTVITTNPNYIMSKAVYSFKVEGFNVVNNPFILPTALVSMAGIGVIIRKKVIK